MAPFTSDTDQAQAKRSIETLECRLFRDGS